MDVTLNAHNQGLKKKGLNFTKKKNHRSKLITNNDVKTFIETK